MHETPITRRAFVRQTTATVAAAATAAHLTTVAHAAGSDVLRVGLVGCGGRGTGAAEQALKADENTRLVAMADVFQDQIDQSLSTLKGSEVGARVDVPADRRHVGFDAFKAVIDQVDVVLLTSTPHFRPIHLAYAVEKGVHTFFEKPVAVDAPGIRKVLELAEEGKRKNLAMVNGFCWRYHTPRRETMKRVADDAIGEIVAVETVYNSGGVWEPRRSRDQVGSDMEYQLRNWYYYTWLSGDHIVEQAIHGLDTMAWALGDRAPIQCWGTGGRQVRTDPKYGNIFDHFSIVYEYPDNVRGYHTCRHWHNTAQRVDDVLLGARGSCDVFANRISGPNKWRYRGPKSDMYQAEHNEMFASIRAGKPLNNAKASATSTLLAIMGRMAAYTGAVVTWDMALNSKEDLSPPKYSWGEARHDPVAIPGVTRLA